MMEAIQHPIHEIILFLALFFAPEDATSIRIEYLNAYRGMGTTILDKSPYEKKSWIEATVPAGHSVELKKESLRRGKEITELSAYTSAVSEHNWCDSSILELPSNSDVLKVKDGYLFFPTGIENPKDRYTITYISAE
ncbi:hypothetical protein [Coraliomargarita parva]|uniref:hypothetical protein n=1 Tax=Coraliomargarita parva TaxID=3014050 RepID=UPI0022B56BB9|nr:hypothetical protein [Coraliomargarita parva]